MAAKAQNKATKTSKSVKRPGIHAKSKTSSNKSSRNYRKMSVGQG